MLKKTFAELLSEPLMSGINTQWHQLDPSLQTTARIEWAVDTSLNETLCSEDSVEMSFADKLARVLSQDPTTFYLTAGLRAFPEDAAVRPINWQFLLENPDSITSPKIKQELLAINVLFTAKLPETHNLWPVFNAHYEFYKAELAIISRRPS